MYRAGFLGQAHHSPRNRRLKCCCKWFFRLCPNEPVVTSSSATAPQSPSKTPSAGGTQTPSALRSPRQGVQSRENLPANGLTAAAGPAGPANLNPDARVWNTEDISEVQSFLVSFLAGLGLQNDIRVVQVGFICKWGPALLSVLFPTLFPFYYFLTFPAA